nr:MAG TPA: hypothetical protein [Caudoviricetes sp.]
MAKRYPLAPTTKLGGFFCVNTRQCDHSTDILSTSHHWNN